MKSMIRVAGALLAGLGAASSASAATFIINNVDPPGIGFNDPTAAAPIGGNSGTSVGEQRRIAYARALALWGAVLESSVPITVRGSFARLNCNATGGTLAQATSITASTFTPANVPPGAVPNLFYGSALYNALAGTDAIPGPPDVLPVPTNQAPADDILANFNGAVGAPDCIAGPGWYYGLDNNAQPGQLDFLNVFMHEVGHGLGFQSFVSQANGNLLGGLPDTYTRFLHDNTTGKVWTDMTTPERLASRVNDSNVVWVGQSAVTSTPLTRARHTNLRIVSEAGPALDLEYSVGQFGALPVEVDMNVGLVLAIDAVADPATGLTLTDGCEPYTNDVRGKIAIIDRGGCLFVQKAQVALAAGATALIIANNVPGSISPGGGLADMPIPILGVSQADGVILKAMLPACAEARQDRKRTFGADRLGRPRVYIPAVFAAGSSVSHWDTSTTPNGLMEPNNSFDLMAARNVDLTPSLFHDIGWKLESLKIGACDTGVANALGSGDIMSVYVEDCEADANTRGQFRSCVAHLANSWRQQKLITNTESTAIKQCSVQSGLQ